MTYRCSECDKFFEETHRYKLVDDTDNNIFVEYNGCPYCSSEDYYTQEDFEDDGFDDGQR